MKKLMVTGIALVVVLMFAMPAAAETKVELGGYYMVAGRYQSNPQLNDDQNAGGAHWRMRFRLQPAFIVSDALRFDSKFDIFDSTSFGNQGAKAKSALIDVDRLWMTIKVPFGRFAAGRMAGGAWGLTFGDDNEDYDRVRFDTKIGNVSTGVILQKNVENDWGSATQVDQDLDVYYLYGVYKADFGAVGLLGAYVNDKRQVAADISKYALLPYFDTKFGMFGVRGELGWSNGEIDPDAVGVQSTDIEELLWNLEADVTFGAFKITGGYAFVQGEDADPLTMTESNATYGGIGDDWDLLVVMMDVDTLINGHAYGSFPAGVKLWYGQVDWAASKSWKFWATIGGAQAENVDTYGAGTDDKMGTEYDVNAIWKVMPNLSWKFRFGYLDAGDFWKTALGVTNLKDTMTAYHELKLSF